MIFYQNARLNADYKPSDKSSLNFELLWSFPGENNHETLNNTNYTVDQSFTNGNRRHSDEIRRTHALEGAINYSKKFSQPGKSLSIVASNNYGKENENTDIVTQDINQQAEITGLSSTQRTYTYQRTNLATAAIDFSQPLPNRKSLDIGYKGIMRDLNSDFGRLNLLNGSFRQDPLNTNLFRFREQIHAIYAQLNGALGSNEEPALKYNLGLRAEKVWNNGETATLSDQFANHYVKVYPSASVIFNLNSEDYLKVSYGRRINRPGLGQLNPFVDITDSLNQHSGNPHLQPELINAFELNYNKSLKVVTLSLTGFYRLRKHSIYNFSVLNSDGVALAKPENFGSTTTYGMEALISATPYQFWNVNLSVSSYQMTIENSTTLISLSRSQFSWYTKLINNWSIGKWTKVQLIANYVSPVAISQGHTVAVYNIDFGLQHTLLEGKGRAGLVVTDIFNTQKSGSFTSDFNFVFNRSTKLDTRAIMLTFGYTFGTTFREKLMENKFTND